MGSSTVGASNFVQSSLSNESFVKNKFIPLSSKEKEVENLKARIRQKDIAYDDQNLVERGISYIKKKVNADSQLTATANKAKLIDVFQEKFLYNSKISLFTNKIVELEDNIEKAGRKLISLDKSSEYLASRISIESDEKEKIALLDSIRRNNQIKAELEQYLLDNKSHYANIKGHLDDFYSSNGEWLKNQTAAVSLYNAAKDKKIPIDIKDPNPSEEEKPFINIDRFFNALSEHGNRIDLNRIPFEDFKNALKIASNDSINESTIKEIIYESIKNNKDINSLKIPGSRESTVYSFPNFEMKLQSLFKSIRGELSKTNLQTNQYQDPGGEGADIGKFSSEHVKVLKTQVKRVEENLKGIDILFLTEKEKSRLIELHLMLDKLNYNNRIFNHVTDLEVARFNRTVVDFMKKIYTDPSKEMISAFVLSDFNRRGKLIEAFKGIKDNTKIMDKIRERDSRLVIKNKLINDTVTKLSDINKRLGESLQREKIESIETVPYTSISKIDFSLLDKMGGIDFDKEYGGQRVDQNKESEIKVPVDYVKRQMGRIQDRANRLIDIINSTGGINKDLKTLSKDELDARMSSNPIMKNILNGTNNIMESFMGLDYLVTHDFGSDQRMGSLLFEERNASIRSSLNGLDFESDEYKDIATMYIDQNKTPNITSDVGMDINREDILLDALLDNIENIINDKMSKPLDEILSKDNDAIEIVKDNIRNIMANYLVSGVPHIYSKEEIKNIFIASFANGLIRYNNSHGGFLDIDKDVIKSLISEIDDENSQMVLEKLQTYIAHVYGIEDIEGNSLEEGTLKKLEESGLLNNRAKESGFLNDSKSLKKEDVYEVIGFLKEISEIDAYQNQTIIDLEKAVRSGKEISEQLKDKILQIDNQYKNIESLIKGINNKNINVKLMQSKVSALKKYKNRIMEEVEELINLDRLKAKS